jgi:3-deoxy-7-phosphoheptulonate synthase
MEVKYMPVECTINLIVRNIIEIGDIRIGGGELVVMAGPCAVETEELLYRTAEAVRREGAHILRGGAYKPRSSPKAFQGLGAPGLAMLRDAAKASGLAVITEVLDTRDVELVAEHADILQIGSRNMQNTALLKEVGKSQRPVMLKRGMSSTLEEWLLAAEYILDAGNPNVILCERGIRTFETATRNTLDLSAVSLIKELSGLPVVVDPSHSTGKRSLVAPMSRAAVAAGADGLIIEVHPEPENAACDGPQSLTPTEFGKLMTQVKRIREAILPNEEGFLDV